VSSGEYNLNIEGDDSDDEITKITLGSEIPKKSCSLNGIAKGFEENDSNLGEFINGPKSPDKKNNDTTIIIRPNLAKMLQCTDDDKIMHLLSVIENTKSSLQLLRDKKNQSIANSENKSVSDKIELLKSEENIKGDRYTLTLHKTCSELAGKKSKKFDDEMKELKQLFKTLHA